MQTKPIAQGGFREHPYAGQKGCTEVRVDAHFRRFRLHAKAIVKLAGVAFLLFPAGCWLLDPENQDEVIEVAVLYWARVRTADGTPISGQLVNFAAFRVTYPMPVEDENASTLQRRTASTGTDGRTYLDARFLLKKGQEIVLLANIKSTDPLYDSDSVEQRINYADASAQNLAQGEKGLASFERTAEFTK